MSTQESSALRYSDATNRIARVITRDFDPSTIREAMVEIIGETLDVDRTLIYDIRFEEDVAEGLCEWLNPAAAGVEPTLDTYPLAIFRGGAELVRATRERIESYADEIHPALSEDGSAELLHGPMQIKSLLWFPFDFEPERLYVLVFNQVRHARRWSESDLTFVESVAELVSMAHLRMRLETQKREREEQAAKKKKLESLGLLAGGVAHDFNNLLTAILGNTSMLARNLEDPKLQPFVADINSAAEAAAAMCKQLLTYAGRAEGDRSLFDLNALVKDTAALAQKHGQVSESLATVPLWVRGDRSQIQQVVLNLLTNAADASADDAEAIAIRTGTLSAGEATARGVAFVSSAPPGPLPFVEIEDHGAGMDAETRARMFEPFFTTKSAGHGLGLAAVHGVLGHHRAGIGIASELGSGTTVTVAFPQASGTAGPSEAARRSPIVPAAGEIRVLVVDDELMVRHVCESILALGGYDVITAGSGEEALELIVDGQEFHAVVLDINMPGLDGRQTLRALRDRGVDVPVVLISAHELGDALRDGDYVHWTFLAKPFRPDELLATVSGMLV